MSRVGGRHRAGGPHCRCTIILRGTCPHSSSGSAETQPHMLPLQVPEQHALAEQLPALLDPVGKQHLPEAPHASP